MRRKNDHSAVGDFVEFFDEDRPLAFEAMNHVKVMNDLSTDVDRRAELSDGSLDRVNGSFDSRAKRSRRRENYFVLTTRFSPALEGCSSLRECAEGAQSSAHGAARAGSRCFGRAAVAEIALHFPLSLLDMFSKHAHSFLRVAPFTSSQDVQTL